MTDTAEKKRTDRLDLETLEVVEPDEAEPVDVVENALNIAETVTGERIKARIKRLETTEPSKP